MQYSKGAQARKYLSRLGALKVSIDIQRDHLAELREMAISLGSPMRSDDPVQTSKSGTAAYTRAVEQIADLEDKICGMIARYAAQRDRITDEIIAMGHPTFARLLELRYIERLRMAEIADTLGYSLDHTKHLHVLALIEFENKILR